MKKRVGLLSVAVIMVLSLALAGCGAANEEDANEGDQGGQEEQGNNEGNNEGEEGGNAENEGEQGTHVGEKVDWEIVGIDPGAGLMSAAEKTIEEYELENWDLMSGSSPAMTAALADAVNNEEPIIVTGWTPHWKFTKFDVKYLEDPKGTFGEAEEIHTVVRQGLEEEESAAYTVLDQFQWAQEDMGSVMVSIQDGAEPADAAQEWVDNNQDKVSQWTEGVENVDGGEVELVYVAWASTIASTNVVQTVLESVGYDVTITQTNAGSMFSGVADGSADAALAYWLPYTHESYKEEYGEQMVDLGKNYTGSAKLGLVVPSYMDIDSIEDLKQ